MASVDGVVAVLLGGSRARGTHAPDSDVDLGVYYAAPLDVAGLTALAGSLAVDVELTEPGAWGPWVDGGGWLRIDDTAVDWIYRDVARVRSSCSDALAGDVRWHFQVGHPLGFPSFGYAAEVAAGVVLADPSGVVRELRAALDPYPPALVARLVAGLTEAEFVLGAARKVVSRGDVAYLAGVLFRAVGLCAHAVCAHARVWVTNEKGLVATADSVCPGFAAQVADTFAALPRDAGAALDIADALRAGIASDLA